MSETLKKRILTALVLIPIVLWLLIWAPYLYFAIFWSVVMVLAAWEWSRLLGWKAQTLQYSYALMSIVILWLVQVNLDAQIMTYYYAVVLLAWLILLPLLYSYPKHANQWMRTPLLFGLGYVFLPSVWWAIIYLKKMPGGYQLLLYLLLIIWAADTGAYFTGKFCGRHKLAPKVSPGKTIEGLIGGVVLSAMVTLLSCFWFSFSLQTSLKWLILSVLTVLISIEGDLFISMLKRHAGVKDSSQLLPGHGGILDRIDSLIAASTVFMLVVTQMGFLEG